MKIKHNYRKKLTNCLFNILNWALPYTCIFCHHPADRQQDLCQACLNDLPIISHACPRCARPVPDALICGECLKNSPPYDRTFARFAYEPPLTRFIMQLKFNHRLINARILGELLAHEIQHHWYRDKPLPQVIIPIPLHAKRLKERGFNQALEIARPISKALNIPIDKNSVLRIKHTSAQATLHAKERQQNIKNAFHSQRLLTQKHIAVLDDVITTGNTIAEFCHTLKQAGAETIDIWCCARPFL